MSKAVPCLLAIPTLISALDLLWDYAWPEAEKSEEREKELRGMKSDVQIGTGVFLVLWVVGIVSNPDK